jgi:hypothetical protein
MIARGGGAQDDDRRHGEEKRATDLEEGAMVYSEDLREVRCYTSNAEESHKQAATFPREGTIRMMMLNGYLIDPRAPFSLSSLSLRIMYINASATLPPTKPVPIYRSITPPQDQNAALAKGMNGRHDFPSRDMRMSSQTKDGL